MTVFVVGELKEFQGKNLVWASTIRPVSEDYFARFLNFTIRGAEFRKANGIVNWLRKSNTSNMCASETPNNFQCVDSIEK